MKLYNYIINKIHDYISGLPETIKCEGCGCKTILSFQEKYKEEMAKKWGMVGISEKYPKQGNAWLCGICLPNLGKYILEKNRITAKNIFKSWNAQS